MPASEAACLDRCGAARAALPLLVALVGAAALSATAAASTVPARIEPCIAACIDPRIDPRINPRLEACIEGHIEGHIEDHIVDHIEACIDPRIEDRMKARLSFLDAAVEPVTTQAGARRFGEIARAAALLAPETESPEDAVHAGDELVVEATASSVGATGGTKDGTTQTAEATLKDATSDAVPDAAPGARADAPTPGIVASSRENPGGQAAENDAQGVAEREAANEVANQISNEASNEAANEVLNGAERAAERPTETTPETAAAPAALFRTDRRGLFVWLVLVGGAMLGAIALAKSGFPVRIRRLAALDAIEEAVGRATEMGRSVLFVPGIQDMNDIQTVAGITVLGPVARTAAEYDARLEVPTSRSLVMVAARETVQAAHYAAERPETYSDSNISYLTDEQFAYVGAVAGKMVRERPAACFYMGAFYAESLLFAETGNSIGAIQIAGTAEPSQLPFFVAACDYTLIGEEFFAASAYLSGEREQLGSILGQDIGKALAILAIVGGSAIATVAVLFGAGNPFGG